MTYRYTISKTALNMLVRITQSHFQARLMLFSQTYKQAKERPDLIIFCVDPGWVKTGMWTEIYMVHQTDCATDMGGEGAMLDPHESVTPLLAFFARATSEHSAGFWNNKGEAVLR
jgi:hypothetical protein